MNTAPPSRSTASAFTAMMGADAVRELLGTLDLWELARELREELGNTRSKQKIKDLSKRLQASWSRSATARTIPRGWCWTWCR
jgi:hypothetical protein